MKEEEELIEWTKIVSSLWEGHFGLRKSTIISR